jgi:hypothetical protein
VAWEAHANILTVTHEEFFGALYTAPSAPEHDARVREIKARFFGLFRADGVPRRREPHEVLAAHDLRLEQSPHRLARVTPEERAQAFRAFLLRFQDMPHVGGLAISLSGAFHLPDPRVLWMSYLGLSRTTGKEQTLPLGTLLQATARRAEVSRGGALVDKPGFTNFHQVYFAPVREARALRAVFGAYGADDGPLVYRDAGTHSARSLMSASRLMVVGSATVSEALRASVAEPNAFRRLTIDPGPEERDAYPGIFAGEPLLSFGGWFDPLAMNTLRVHPGCRDVDWLVTIANPSPGLWDFQRRALRAVFEGYGAVFRSGARRSDPASEVNAFSVALRRVQEGSLEISGKRGRAFLDFNWDDPRPGNEADAAAQALDRAVLLNRSALFVAAYQHGARRLDVALGGHGPARPALRAKLGSFDVWSFSKPEELVRASRAALGLGIAY